MANGSSMDGLETLFGNLQEAPPPPPALRSFARQEQRKFRSAEAESAEAERRSQMRHYRCLDGRGVPIDAGQMQVAEPIACSTRDISRGGVALVLPRMVASNLLAIELHGDNGATMRNIVEVLRCRPAGMFFEAAGAFVKLIAQEDIDRLLGLAATRAPA